MCIDFQTGSGIQYHEQDNRIHLQGAGPRIFQEKERELEEHVILMSIRCTGS